MIKHIAMAGALAAAGIGLSACSSGYGYTGVSAGYGYGGYGYNGYGYNNYYDDFYDGGFGTPYWGWYNNYYYPGTGVYVYDRNRRPYRLNRAQREYWNGRQRAWRGDHTFHDEWRGFDRGPGRRGSDRGVRSYAPGAFRQGNPGVVRSRSTGGDYHRGTPGAFDHRTGSRGGRHHR